MDAQTSQTFIAVLKSIENQLGYIKLALQGIEKKLDKNENKPKRELKARIIGEEDD